MAFFDEEYSNVCQFYTIGSTGFPHHETKHTSSDGIVDDTAIQ